MQEQTANDFYTDIYFTFDAETYLRLVESVKTASDHASAGHDSGLIEALDEALNILETEYAT